MSEQTKGGGVPPHEYMTAGELVAPGIWMYQGRAYFNLKQMCEHFGMPLTAESEQMMREVVRELVERGDRVQGVRSTVVERHRGGLPEL